jgi:hypothetical protein
MNRRKIYLHLQKNGLLSEFWELTKDEFNTMNKSKRKAYTTFRTKRGLSMFVEPKNTIVF